MFAFNGMGRLVKAAEVKEFGERKVINFSLITSNSVKRNGEWTEEPVSIQVHYWVSKNAKLDQFLAKGTQVAVFGHIAQESWGEGDAKQYRLVVEASNVILGAKAKEGESTGSSTPASKPTAKTDEKPAAKAPEVEVEEDEIPF